MSDDGITVGHAFAAGAGAYLAYRGLEWISNNVTPEMLADVGFQMELQRIREAGDLDKFDAIVLSQLPRPVTVMTPLPYWLTAEDKMRLSKRIAEETWLTAKARTLAADWLRKENPPCPPMAKSLLQDLVANLTRNADVKKSVQMTLASLDELRRAAPSSRETVAAFIKARLLRKSPIQVILWLGEENPAWASLTSLQHSAKWVGDYQEHMRTFEEFRDARLFRKRGGKKPNPSFRNKLTEGQKLLTAAPAAQKPGETKISSSNHKKTRRVGRTGMNLRTRTILSFYDDARISGGLEQRARAVAAGRLPLKKNLPQDDAVKRNCRAVDYAVRNYRNNGDWDYSEAGKSDATLK